MKTPKRKTASLAPTSRDVVDRVFGQGRKTWRRQGGRDGQGRVESLFKLLEMLPADDPGEELVKRTVRRVKRSIKYTRSLPEGTSDSNYLYLQV